MQEIRVSGSPDPALVDDEDYEFLNRVKWHVVKKHGGRKYAYLSHDKGSFDMSRLLVEKRKGREVVHLNGNTLDYRKSNLAVITRNVEAQRNAKTQGTASQYKGVSRSHNGKWRARMRVGYKEHHIGVFSTEEEAALAYNVAVKEQYGEHAWLNDLSASTELKKG